ncbi:MAG: NAD-dependent epimerase/dehydratase family protein [Candidatus Hodarchaeales archaeon]
MTLITGATGFLGGHFIRYLSEREPNEELRLLVRNTSLEKAKKAFGDIGNITYVVGDLQDLSALKKVTEGINRIFHLAAAADDNIDKKTLHEVNVEGTENLLKALKEKQQQIFFCHLSSTGVYGNKLPKNPIKEDHKKAPSSEYQASKWRSEQVVWHYFNNGLKGTILRSPSIIGPGDLKTFYRMCEAVINHKFPQVGNGHNSLTFIDVDDLCQALTLSAAYQNQEKTEHQVYNLYSFRTTLNELLNRLVSEFGAKKPRKINYRFAFALAVLSELYSKLTGKQMTLNRYRIRKFGASRSYDSSQIEADVNYKSLHSFENTMKRSLDWLYQHDYLKS